MSTTLMNDPIAISAPETKSSSATNTTVVPHNEVEFAICDCCGLTEECTLAYIKRIRERYNGKWVCGLCAEAVKDEIVRSERFIGIEEALTRHMNFFQKFKTSRPPINPTMHLISTMRQILRRSLDNNSPRVRSTPPTPTKIHIEIGGSGLNRSESCFSTLSSS